jgi:hypothetical protein
MPPQPDNVDEREVALHWYAVHYRITKDPASLATLIGLTLSGERILPSLVPLNELPKNRPELSRPYPLEVVLQSGWKDAIKLRLPEIPKLEIELLGRYRVKYVGKEIALTKVWRSWSPAPTATKSATRSGPTSSQTACATTCT